MRGQHHVGITVADLERSLEFYVGILGLELAGGPTEIFDDENLGPAVGVPGARLRCALLRLGDGLLELLQYHAPASPVETPLPQNALGAQHVAFAVDDVHACKQALEAQGVEFLADVTVVDDGPLAGWRWVYFRDPDGNALELVENAYPAPYERGAS
jgi:catechol 2,3-dioxygenase-like lactoylglutathione lyase family enzyme